MRTRILCLCAAVVGCGGGQSAPAPTAATVAPAAELPRPEQIRDDAPPAGGVPLIEAIADGRVHAEITGWDVSQTRLQLTASLDLVVVVSAGTFFAGASDQHQNMIVTGTGWIALGGGRTTAILVETACTNLHRRAPRESDPFTIAPPQPGLGELAICLSRLHLGDGIRQAVIWKFTDNAGQSDIVTRRELYLPRLQRHCDKLRDRHRARCKELLATTFAEVVASYFDQTHGEADACLAAARAR